MLVAHSFIFWSGKVLRSSSYVGSLIFLEGALCRVLFQWSIVVPAGGCGDVVLSQSESGTGCNHAVHMRFNRHLSHDHCIKSRES